MHKNTAEGDPAVFFVCHKKHKNHSGGPSRRAAKKYTVFLCYLRIDKVVRGGGTLSSSKPEGFRLGMKKL